MMSAVHDAILDVDLLVLMRDASVSTGNGDRFVLDLISRSEKKAILVLNKIDMLQADERKTVAARLVRRLRWRGPSFCISALTGEGCRELSFAVMKFLESGKTA